MRKIALITGATSGIGRATAELFAANEINLILCGRRQDRLEDLKNQLEKKIKIHTLNFDVSNRDAVFNAINSLPSDFSEIDILINNAGNAHGLDSIEKGSVDDWDAMIDSNVKGLLYVSKSILPTMVKRNSGHIINIGSIAGKEVYPKGNVYCASKYAVDALTKSMQIDLNPYGIRVGAVNPGAVQTEFSKVRFKTDDPSADDIYKGFVPLKPQDIADIIHFVVTRPYHVNIADLVVMPTAQGSATVFNKKL